MRLVVVLCLALNVFTYSPAYALYVATYAGWRDLPDPVKQGYVIGIVDAWVGMVADGGDAWSEAQRVGIQRCTAAQRVTSTMLVQLVDAHYLAYTADWRVSPAVVVRVTLGRTCLADINLERKKIGLDPWQRNAGQISSDGG